MSKNHGRMTVSVLCIALGGAASVASGASAGQGDRVKFSTVVSPSEFRGTFSNIWHGDRAEACVVYFHESKFRANGEKIPETASTQQHAEGPAALDGDDAELSATAFSFPPVSSPSKALARLTMGTPDAQKVSNVKQELEKLVQDPSRLSDLLTKNPGNYHLLLALIKGDFQQTKQDSVASPFRRSESDKGGRTGSRPCSADMTLERI